MAKRKLQYVLTGLAALVVSSKSFAPPSNFGGAEEEGTAAGFAEGFIDSTRNEEIQRQLRAREAHAEALAKKLLAFARSAQSSGFTWDVDDAKVIANLREISIHAPMVYLEAENLANGFFVGVAPSSGNPEIHEYFDAAKVLLTQIEAHSGSRPFDFTSVQLARFALEYSRTFFTLHGVTDLLLNPRQFLGSEREEVEALIRKMYQDKVPGRVKMAKELARLLANSLRFIAAGETRQSMPFLAMLMGSQRDRLSIETQKLMGDLLMQAWNEFESERNSASRGVRPAREHVEAVFAENALDVRALQVEGLNRAASALNSARGLLLATSNVYGGPTGGPAWVFTSGDLGLGESPEDVRRQMRLGKQGNRPGNVDSSKAAIRARFPVPSWMPTPGGRDWNAFRRDFLRKVYAFASVDRNYADPRAEVVMHIQNLSTAVNYGAYDQGQLVRPLAMAIFRSFMEPEIDASAVNFIRAMAYFVEYQVTNGSYKGGISDQISDVRVRSSEARAAIDAIVEWFNTESVKVQRGGPENLALRALFASAMNAIAHSEGEPIHPILRNLPDIARKLDSLGRSRLARLIETAAWDKAGAEKAGNPASLNDLLNRDANIRSFAEKNERRAAQPAPAAALNPCLAIFVGR